MRVTNTIAQSAVQECSSSQSVLQFAPAWWLAQKDTSNPGKNALVAHQLAGPAFLPAWTAHLASLDKYCITPLATPPVSMERISPTDNACVKFINMNLERYHNQSMFIYNRASIDFLVYFLSLIVCVLPNSLQFSMHDLQRNIHFMYIMWSWIISQ